jgi:hypothetical protein
MINFVIDDFSLHWIWRVFILAAHIVVVSINILHALWLSHQYILNDWVVNLSFSFIPSFLEAFQKLKFCEILALVNPLCFKRVAFEVIDKLFLFLCHRHINQESCLSENLDDLNDINLSSHLDSCISLSFELSCSLTAVFDYFSLQATAEPHIYAPKYACAYHLLVVVEQTDIAKLQTLLRLHETDHVFHLGHLFLVFEFFICRILLLIFGYILLEVWSIT